MRNLGQDAASGASVTGRLSTQLDTAFASWTCLGPSGSQCSSSGEGELHDSGLGLPGGGSISYLVTAPVRWDADGSATLTGQTAHADDANPANDEQSAGAPIVILRDGFDGHGSTAALPAATERLDEDHAIAIALPASTQDLLDRVLIATAAGSTEVFRIERLNGAEATWLRVVARDENGQAYASAWMRVGPASVLEVRLLGGEGTDGARRVLELRTDAGIVTIPLTDRATGYTMRSASPMRSLPKAN